MRRFAALAAALLLSAAPARAGAPLAAPCSDAVSTLAMTECLAGEIRRAEAVLGRYLRAAQRRLVEEAKQQGMRGGASGSADLFATQRLWLAYRRAHCGDIASRWQGASIRPVLTAECLLRLTRRRTHELWSDYLTFMDRTAPLLPDPDGPPPAPSDGPKR